jgi:hypothetical protein
MGKWLPMTGFANVLLAGLLNFSSDFALENTNIFAYQQQLYTVDYNRTRADLALQHNEYTDLAARLIVDNETLYTANPDSLQNKTSIYRAYCQYRGKSHFWSLGKQRIPLGVGRIWNPIDVFNPVDAEAIEPEEREGTDAVRYEYATGELSNLDITLAEGKGAVRIKGYLNYADVGLVGLWDDDESQDIIGWELEGEIGDTGIELRSEGGRFHDRASKENHTEFIVGAEYGFVGSLTLLGEYYYSDETAVNHFAVQAGYQPAMLWTCSLLILTNIDDHSGFVAPSIEYSLSDEMTLSGGAFIYSGDNEDEFGSVPDRFYLRWFVHF